MKEGVRLSVVHRIVDFDVFHFTKLLSHAHMVLKRVFGISRDL